MEEIAVRSWVNPIIRESYDWMLKVGRELKEELVLVGGWATYFQAQKLKSMSLPSLDIDFVALKGTLRQINVLCISCTFRFLFAEKFIKLVTKIVTI